MDIIMNIVPLLLGGVLGGWGLYQLVRCVKGTKVTAYLVGYEEKDIETGDPATSGTRYARVYRYTWEGCGRTYQSSVLLGYISTLMPGKESKTLYLDADGKAYELSAAVTWLLSAVIVIVLGESLL